MGGAARPSRLESWAGVKSPDPGPSYYRTCLATTTDRTLDHRVPCYAPPAPGAQNGAGRHTATLGTGGKACGEWAAPTPPPAPPT